MTQAVLLVILGMVIACVGFVLSWAQPRPGRSLLPLRAVLGIGLIFAGLALAALAGRSMQ